MYQQTLVLISYIKSERLKSHYLESVMKIAKMNSSYDRKYAFKSLRNDIKGDLSYGS